MPASETAGILYITPIISLLDLTEDDILRLSSGIPDFGSIEGEWI